MPRSTPLAFALLVAVAACDPTPTEPAQPAVPASAAFDGETPPPPPPDTTGLAGATPPPPADTTGRGGGSLGSGT